MKYIVILVISVGAILSGCINTELQRPLYYDEKAVYLINKSVSAAVEKDYDSLFSDSKKYYNELDKLIISPEMQPAVDEYNLALKDFQDAGWFYNTYESDIVSRHVMTRIIEPTFQRF